MVFERKREIERERIDREGERRDRLRRKEKDTEAEEIKDSKLSNNLNELCCIIFPFW